MRPRDLIADLAGVLLLAVLLVASLYVGWGMS